VSPAQTRQQARQAQRQERQLRQREDRTLRALPPKQRAARREQIQQQRQERAAQRQQQATPAARGIVTPNATIAPNARGVVNANRGLRRNGQARTTPQVARQGRFAAARATSPHTLNSSAVTANARVAAVPQARTARYAPRRAWQRGLRAAFVPWYGPVFWPYAYSDIFDYTFFPSGYEDSYWDYAYDDFFDGVFYGEVGPPQEYVTETTGSAPSTAAPAQPTYTAMRDLCAQPGNGITAWPIAEIETKVGLHAEQKQLLAGVKEAGSKAAAVFKATCPSENAFPLTPPGRLASMTGRLDATLSAVQTVKPALETFYDSLNDEQKERFNQIGPSKAAASPEAQAATTDDAKKCGEAKPGLTNLPIEQIEDVIAPNDAQQAELDKLGEATVKAVGVLQAACPAETPLTPPGRLQAIETRLQAMIEAANTVKPALNGFYASLNAEQKARFNRLGRELAKSDTGASNQ
jgi:hypothetical protein